MTHKSFSRRLLEIAGVVAFAGIARRFASGKPSNEQPARQNRQRSTAPNASWQTGAGSENTGFDSPATGSISLSNPDVQGPEHLEPYYPPGAEEYTGEERGRD